MAPLQQFNRSAMGRIADAVRVVESMPGSRKQDGRGRGTPYATVVRLAQTTTNLANPSYPDRGNAVVIQFGDYDGPELIDTANTITFSTYDGATDADKVIALVWKGLLPAQSEIVQAFRFGGRWFIEGMTFVKGRATTTITAGGSGSATLYVNGISQGTFTVYYDWMTGGGNIASGTDLFCQWFSDEQQWVVVGAECGA